MASLLTTILSSAVAIRHVIAAARNSEQPEMSQVYPVLSFAADALSHLSKPNTSGRCTAAVQRNSLSTADGFESRLPRGSSSARSGAEAPETATAALWLRRRTADSGAQPADMSADASTQQAQPAKEAASKRGKRDAASFERGGRQQLLQPQEQLCTAHEAGRPEDAAVAPISC